MQTPSPPWDKLKVVEYPILFNTPISPFESTGHLEKETISLIDKVANLGDAQISLLILRTINNSTQMSKLRTSLPEANELRIAEMRSCIHYALSKILGQDVTKLKHVITRIHMQQGPGLGFTKLDSIAKEAFQASWLQANFRVNKVDGKNFPMPSFEAPSDTYEIAVQEALNDMTLLVNSPEVKLQHAKTAQKKKEQLDKDFQSLSPEQKTIVKSAWSKFAGAWLSAIPSESGLTLPDSLMRIALCLFLGVPLRPDIKECPCCQKEVSGADFNVHILKCVSQFANYVRHDAIKYCIAELARQARIPVTIEKRPFEGTNRRPDAILHGLGENSKDVAIDFSAADPFAIDNKEDDPPLKAGEAREKVKNRKYLSITGDSLIFRPVVIETYGGITEDSLRHVIKPLINRIDDFVALNWAASSARVYWYERFTIILWRFNAQKVKYFLD